MTDAELDEIIEAVDRGESWPWMLRYSDFTDDERDKLERVIDARILECEERKRAAILKLIEHRQSKVQ